MRHKKNITLNSRNITPHFTGTAKIITLILVIIMLSFVNIINTSALSYQSSVGVGFTFNPTLSINISSSDLVISNLEPGTTEDSNSINVSISSNNANGYTMFATVGNKKYNNANLSHSNTIDSFSSITTNANLASLTTDDTWGYSYSTDHGLSWSNYNGLPLYSSSGTALINKLGPAESDIDFKIAARASNTQASGAYENVINFIAITRSNPVSLEDAYNSYYLSTGKTKHNGYYAMQDMNSTICNNVELPDSELQVIDIRDDKVYWIAKLRDGNCWMTQNLDLDLISDTSDDNYSALTSDNTDLTDITNNAYQDGYSTQNGIITWLPERSTIVYDKLSSSTWGHSQVDPYSYDRLDIPSGMPVYPDSIATESTAGSHGLSGNYYNWTASVASNDSTGASGSLENSICPRGWRLPNNPRDDFGKLLMAYDIIDINDSGYYLDGGFEIVTSAPLYFIRAGSVHSGKMENSGVSGWYYSNTVRNVYRVYHMLFNEEEIRKNSSTNGGYGGSVRCLAR